MAEVDIEIGGRVFQVACQAGEEEFLYSAASLLDNEAQSLADALGRVPSERMLLMAGLMLADKTAGLEEELRKAERKLAEQAVQPGAPVAPMKPETEVVEVEVEVIPQTVIAAFSKIADRAEGVASQVEDAAAG
ncbi:MAG: cell division protein ZapA [Alphaproteobacteria bacterium]|nr:cell division protein ZapA [Alphaproteobacteria bacterium]